MNRKISVAIIITMVVSAQCGAEAIAPYLASSPGPTVCSPPKLKPKSNPMPGKTTDSRCCCAPTISVTNSMGGVSIGSGPASAASATVASGPKDSSAEYYKALSDNVTQVAKNAIESVQEDAKETITSAQGDVDSVWKIVAALAIIFSIVTGIGSWFGITTFKAIRENWAKELEKIKTELEEISQKAEKEIKEHMAGMTAASLLENFLSSAMSKWNYAEQIELILKNPLNHGKMTGAEFANFRATLGSTLDDARKQAQLALSQLDKADPVALNAIAASFRTAKNSAKADSAILENWIYTLLGWLAKRQSDLAGAVRFAQKATAANPDDGVALYNLAFYYSLQGQVEKAFECLEKALDKDDEARRDAKGDDDLDSMRAYDGARFDRLIGE